MTFNNPIGVFDSGIGGLTVLQELLQILPHEEFIYFADMARMPYGIRSEDELSSYITDILDWMVSMNVKAAVMACHTGSATTLHKIKDDYGIPVIGTIEPTALSLQQYPNVRSIGIISTPATANSCSFDTHFRNAGFMGPIKAVGCEDFVPMIELNEADEMAISDACHRYLTPLIEEGCDAVIYGCTHYPLLHKHIANVVQGRAILIDPAKDVAIHLRSVLQDLGLLRMRDGANEMLERNHKFYSSAMPENLQKAVKKILGFDVEVTEVTW